MCINKVELQKIHPQMQRVTLEEERQKPNFIEKVYEKIAKSKNIATVSLDKIEASEQKDLAKEDHELEK